MGNYKTIRTAFQMKLQKVLAKGQLNLRYSCLSEDNKKLNLELFYFYSTNILVLTIGKLKKYILNLGNPMTLC